ncbi:MAG: hypothetical protein AB7L66_00870 [Gemmatimonadales bacterium]
MNVRASLTAAASTLLLLAACQGESSPAGVLEPTASFKTTGSDPVALVSCELRSGRRSKVSVDGNNLSPRGGMFTATITSGANTATSPAVVAVGDEAEFDFDSSPADIRAGATAISRSFITGSVSAVIRGADGAVVASGTGTCRVR